MPFCHGLPYAVRNGRLPIALTANPTSLPNLAFQGILEIYRANFSTQVLAGSLRHPMHVVEAAKLASRIATMPCKVFEQLFVHPLTDRGLEAFLKDSEKARKVLVRRDYRARQSTQGCDLSRARFLS